MRTPPVLEADTVTPFPDPTPLPVLRAMLPSIPDEHARVVLEMEIFLREVWGASHATLGGDRRGRRLAREKRWLEEVFGKVELLHVPAFGLPTPTLAECAGHAASPTLSDAYGRFTWPFAFLGLPSIVVPVGFQKDGLPAGMQLAGRPFAEALLLNAAHLYQRETRWHEKAPALPK